MDAPVSQTHGHADAHVVLQSRRRERAQTVQKIQHAVPALALLYEGWHGISTGEQGFGLALAICEIVSSALLLGSVARSLRSARRARHTAPHGTAVSDGDNAQAEHAHDAHDAHGVDWVDVFAAAVLAVEAWSQWHVRRHVARPTILLVFITLAMGLLHGRIADRAARRRALRLTSEGLTIGGRFFRRFSARWDEIARIDIGAREATISTVAGRERRIDLADLHNAAAVRALLYAARQRLAPAAGDAIAAPR